MKNIQILFFLLLTSVFSFGQNSQLEKYNKAEDFLKKKNKKFKDVSGTMVVDIGVVQNGKVSSFFKVESDIKNIDFINFMSDYILDHKFQFKLQKQQRYKIRYSITF